MYLFHTANLPWMAEQLLKEAGFDFIYQPERVAISSSETMGWTSDPMGRKPKLKLSGGAGTQLLPKLR